MKKIISVLLCVILILCSVSVAAFAEDSNELRFGADGKFTVLQITDTQDDAVLANGLVEFIEKARKTRNTIFAKITEKMQKKDVNIFLS